MKLRKLSLNPGRPDAKNSKSVKNLEDFSLKVNLKKYLSVYILC